MLGTPLHALNTYVVIWIVVPLALAAMLSLPPGALAEEGTGYTGGVAVVLQDLGKSLVAKRDSAYLDANVSAKFDARGSSGSSADSSDASGWAAVDAEGRTERRRYGYYYDGEIRGEATDYSRDIENTSTNGGSSTTTESASDSRLVIGSRSPSFALFDDQDYARAGRKWYFSETSPYFYFGEGQTRLDTEADSPGLRAGAGLGYGQIVDLAAYERVRAVESILGKAGLLREEFSRPVTESLLPVFKQTSDEQERMRELQATLEREGLVSRDSFTYDIAYDIQHAIDTSFENRKYGLEIRGGLFQELVTEYDDQDERTFAEFVGEYDYPLADKHQLVIQGECQVTLSGGEDNQLLGIEAEVQSLLNPYTRSTVGVSATAESTESTDSNREALYGELLYELTTTTRFSTMAEVGTTSGDSEDSVTSYAVSSGLVYDLY